MEKLFVTLVVITVFISPLLLLRPIPDEQLKSAEPNYNNILVKYYWVDNCTGDPEYTRNNNNTWKPREIYLPLTHQCLGVYNCTKDNCLTQLCSGASCDYCYDKIKVIERNTCQTNRIMRGSFKII